MAMTTRALRSGRIMIELDGCSDYYGGALVQGALIAKFSVPANLSDAAGVEYASVEHMLQYLPDCPNAGPDYIDSIRNRVKGIRIYEWRRVQ